ncbi:MAG: folate family ECF transporter S component [Oscillospiraceae bacterium]|nr:folate family ECF transporter S component [Oscillospiraceae bacterium]
MKNDRIKLIVVVALMVACQFVLERIIAINTPIVKLSFGFIPLSITAILFGPVWAAVCGALADFIGAILMPFGPYVPWFTITAALSGMVYGFMLKNAEKLDNKKIIVRCLLASLVNAVVFELIINSALLMILYGNGLLALLPARLLKTAWIVVVQTVVMPLPYKQICTVVRKFGGRKRA